MRRCITKIGDDVLTKHLLNSAGLSLKDDYSPEEIQKLVKAAKDLQQQHLSSLNDIYADVGVKGYNKISQPKKQANAEEISNAGETNRAPGQQAGTEAVNVGGESARQQQGQQVNENGPQAQVLNQPEGAAQQAAPSVIESQPQKPRFRVPAEQVEKAQPPKVTPEPVTPKEVKTPKERSQRQENINKLRDRVDSFNKMRANDKNKSAALNELRLDASELGLNIDYGKGYAILRYEAGGKVQRRSAETNAKRAKNFDPTTYSQATQDAVNKIVAEPTLMVGLAITGQDGYRFSEAQREAAIQSIRDGKPNNGAKAIYDFLENATNGNITIEDPVTGQEAQVSMSDYFATAEKAAVEIPDDDIDAINSQLGEDAFNDVFDELYDNVSNIPNEPETIPAERVNAPGKAEQATQAATEQNQETTGDNRGAPNANQKAEEARATKVSKLADKLKTQLGGKANLPVELTKEPEEFSSANIPAATGDFSVIEARPYLKIEDDNFTPDQQLKFNQGDKFEAVRVIAHPDLIELISIGAKINKQYSTGINQNVPEARRLELESKYGVTATEANKRARDLAKANRNADHEVFIILGQKKAGPSFQFKPGSQPQTSIVLTNFIREELANKTDEADIKDALIANGIADRVAQEMIDDTKDERQVTLGVVGQISHWLGKLFGTKQNVFIAKDQTSLMSKASQVVGNISYRLTNGVFETRDGVAIGFNYDTDKVARERFDFTQMVKIGQGSDRVVFDMGDGNVLKVAKTARGLEQNIYEGSWDLVSQGILPRVNERGLNYIVVEKVSPAKGEALNQQFVVTNEDTGEETVATIKSMVEEFSNFNQYQFDSKTSKIQDVLAKYGLRYILGYNLIWGDFAEKRNWGMKDGKPIHLDGGTFGGVEAVLVSYVGKKNLDDSEFRDIYNKSRALKKQYGDKDKFTMFQGSFTEEQKNVFDQLTKAQDEYRAAKSSFEAKRKELDKGLVADQTDLFGERTSTPAAGTQLFDERASSAARDKAIIPFKERLLKAEDNVNKLQKKFNNLAGKGTSQLPLFHIQEGNSLVPVKQLPEGLQIVNGFYSPIEKSIRETKAENKSAKQWLDQLGKGDEMTFTGLRAYLQGYYKPDEQVKKQDILDYIQDNKIEIDEVVKGYNLGPVLSLAEMSEFNDLLEEAGYFGFDTRVQAKDEIYRRDNWVEKFNVKNKRLIEVGNKFKNEMLRSTEAQPGYFNYQLPGPRENYREVLITWPPKQVLADEVAMELYNKPYDELSYNERVEANQEIATRNRAQNKFRSSHFSEPNILTHLRTNIRESSDGKKTLFIEEIQSDWAQTGKREGFALTQPVLPKDVQILSDIQSYYDEVYKDFRHDVVFKVKGFPERDKVSYYPAIESVDQLKQRLADSYTKNMGSNVATGPFIQKTSSWVKLALKTAMHHAVRQGATQIAWTTGEQQNDRYDLSKQISSIQYYYSRNHNDYELTVIKNGQTLKTIRGLSEKEVEDYVGKEVAQKIVNGEGKEYLSGVKELSGLDLKVGGKGMISFYGSLQEKNPGIVGQIAKSLFGQELKLIGIRANENKGGYKIFEDGELIIEGATPEQGYVKLAELKQESPNRKYRIEIEPQSLKTTNVYGVDINTRLVDEVNAGLPMFMKSPSGDILGFSANGKIYLNGARLNPETPIHEAGHIWTEWAKDNATDIYDRGIELINNSQYLQQVKASPFYQSEANKLPVSEREKYYQHEALATAIGDKGAKFISDAKKKGFTAWLKELWDRVGKALGFKDILSDELQNLTLDEFAERAAVDILKAEVNPRAPVNVVSNDVQSVAKRIRNDELSFNEAIVGKDDKFVDALRKELYGTKRFNLDEDAFRESVRKKRDLGMSKADVISDIASAKKITNKMQDIIDDVFLENAEAEKALEEFQEAVRDLAKGVKPKKVLVKLSTSNVASLVMALKDHLSYVAVSNKQLEDIADYIIDTIDVNDVQDYIEKMYNNNLSDVKQLLRAKAIVELQKIGNNTLAKQLALDMADDAVAAGRQTQSLRKAYEILQVKGSAAVKSEFARKFIEKVQQASRKMNRQMADVIQSKEDQIAKLNQKLHEQTQKSPGLFERIKNILDNICNVRRKK